MPTRLFSRLSGKKPVRKSEESYRKGLVTEALTLYKVREQASMASVTSSLKYSIGFLSVNIPVTSDCLDPPPFLAL